MSQVMLGEGEAARRFPGVGTPPPKRYKIGELARHTGLTRQTLHNYTRWGLIAEAGWTAGGHRFYDASVFPRLARILALKTHHRVEQIRVMLDAGDAAEETGAGDGR